MSKYPNIKVKLAGEDGNAFSIIGRVTQAMRRGGIPQEEIDLFLAEATSGDYDKVLRTALVWVNCDGLDDPVKELKRYTNSDTSVMEDYWSDVAYAVEDAHLIAWDTCHKIYLAMDEVQADWFRTHYPTNFHGTPNEMLLVLRKWYEDSCSLKFIQSVTTWNGDPNEGYNSLIPQGAEDEGKCDECGDTPVYADGLCHYCWDYDENNGDEDF